MRTFIAVDLDPAIKARLSDLLRRLRWRGPKGVTWTRETALHVTLKFLGEIDEARLADVVAVLRSAARSVPAFPLSVRGTGEFPGPPRPPRVFWAGTDEPAAFAGLFSGLEAGLAGLGFERETRPFHPHVTLGRVKNPSGIRDAAVELERVRGEEFGRMTVVKVTLFRSTLRPDGAVYSVLEEAPLS
jgi:RNA 2',3'-cyclic 3'-phosphodiesterase